MEVRTQHKFKDEWLARALLDYQIISEEYLEEMRIRHSDSEHFSEVLIRTNQLKAADIAEFVESILQIPFVDLDEIDVNPKAVEQIKEDVCLKYQVFPFNLREDHIAVAFSNPFDLDAEREISFSTGKFVKSFFAFKDSVKNKIAEYYSPNKFIDKIVDRANSDKAVKIVGETDANSESSVVKLVSLVIGDAISQEASDIHIEPKEKLVLVRYRIDGILRTILEVPKSVQPSLISRIKIISNLDIAESRKPQDGKAKVQHEGAKIDLRISVLPTSFGEKVVIRILDRRNAKVSFQHLGIRGKNLELLEKCFAKTQGIVLVTGPTGSGKTTSLYAALNRIRNNTNNILTIEDPIEYMMEGINQVQVNEKAGVTFASALRSFLRQDPDVILVGEIRDKETAEIAVQAALTGHLVLSTLHTNDSLGAITRLADMGIDVYKTASSLEAVIGQRLLRTLCPKCKAEKEPDVADKKLIPYMTRMGYEPKFYKAEGCQSCGYTGYKGRVGIYEILFLDEELKDLVGGGESMSMIRKIARKKGFESLYEDAVKHIAEGITDYKEVLRVINPDTVESVPVPERESQPKATAVSKAKSVEQVPEETSSSEAEAEPVKPEKPVMETPKASPPEIVENKTPEKIPTVLLVEDNFGMRKLARTLIEKKTNWKLLEAEDGMKGLEMVTKSKPDLIVLDVMMPQMSGYEFLERLKNSLSTAAIPVLLLTALDGQDNEVKGFELGADDYLTKPYNINVLLARIKRLLNRSTSLQAASAPSASGDENIDLKLV